MHYIADTDELLTPIIIPTNIMAGLDENTTIAFSFKDAKTIDVTISSDDLSSEATDRLRKFMESVKKLGYEINSH